MLNYTIYSEPHVKYMHISVRAKTFDLHIRNI